MVMGFSGLRKGEMLTLRWSDLDFKNKVIRVRRTLFFKDKREIIQSAKTGASKRETPLTDKEIELLKKWKVMQKERFLKNGIKEIDYVVCRDNLKPLRLADPNETLNGFLDKHTELPRIRVHGLRHTFASNLYAAKVDVKTAQKFLGHRRMEPTMNIYTHVAKKIKIEEVGKYKDYMKDAKSKCSHKPIFKHQKSPSRLLGKGLEALINQRFENCGARRAPLSPYFLRSFILGSRVRNPAFFRTARYSGSASSNARATP